MKTWKFNTLWTLGLVALVGPSALSQSQLLSEKSIVQLAKENAPRTQINRAQLAQSVLEKKRLEAQFEARAEVSYQYSESREQGLASFMPIFSPTRDVNLGLAKKLPYGVKVHARAFGSQINAPSAGINNATRTGTQLGLEVDLLKNFFGKFDRYNLKEKQALVERAKAQEKLSQKSFEIDARILYWSLIANEKSLELSRQLVESAQVQLRDAKKRARAGAADRGDVARSEAQLLSRKSSVYLFQYEKEQISSQLKKLFPQLKDHTLELKKEDMGQAVRGVLSCVGEITSNSIAQSTHSDLFVVLEKAKLQYSSEQRKAESTGDWDLKLTSSVQFSAVDEGFTASRERYQEGSQDGYAVGFSLSIPLEGDLREAEKAHIKLVENSFQAELQTIESEIHETHKEVSRSLLLLQDAAVALKMNVINLEKSMKSTKRKYRQARISINELIGEQDQLFQSRLSEIATKLAVIQALYNYFKVFNNHPCRMNNI